MNTEQFKLLDDTPEAIMTILERQKYVMNGKRKLRVQHAVVVEKLGKTYIVALPLIQNLYVGDCIPLKQLVINGTNLDIDEHISGLMLMPNEHGLFEDREGIVNSINQYNNISENIGSYRLFGEIKTLVSFY